MPAQDSTPGATDYIRRCVVSCCEPPLTSRGSSTAMVGALAGCSGAMVGVVAGKSGAVVEVVAGVGEVVGSVSDVFAALSSSLKRGNRFFVGLNVTASLVSGGGDCG